MFLITASQMSLSETFFVGSIWSWSTKLIKAQFFLLSWSSYFPIYFEFTKFYNTVRLGLTILTSGFVTKFVSNFFSSWIIFARKIASREKFTAWKISVPSYGGTVLILSWDTLILLEVDLILYLCLLTLGYQLRAWVVLHQVVIFCGMQLFHEQGFFFSIHFWHY